MGGIVAGFIVGCAVNAWAKQRISNGWLQLFIVLLNFIVQTAVNSYNALEGLYTWMELHWGGFIGGSARWLGFWLFIPIYVGEYVARRIMRPKKPQDTSQPANRNVEVE